MKAGLFVSYSKGIRKIVKKFYSQEDEEKDWSRTGKIALLSVCFQELSDEKENGNKTVIVDALKTISVFLENKIYPFSSYLEFIV